jgi:hypothetical protein
MTSYSIDKVDRNMNAQCIAIVIFVLTLPACSRPSETAPTSVAPVTIAGTESPVPDQVILAATKKIGTPVPGWEGIPVMPGAYASELADMVYLYTVDTPIDQVEEYYQAKMDVNGWMLTNRQELDAGPTGGPSTVLDYQKSDRLLNVMLVNLVEKNATTVILSQLGP